MRRIAVPAGPRLAVSAVSAPCINDGPVVPGTLSTAAARRATEQALATAVRKSVSVLEALIQPNMLT